MDDTLGMEFSTLFRLIRGSYFNISSTFITTFRFVGRLGFGRQGALAATRRAFPHRARTPLRKAISLLVGAMFIGTGVALLTQANLGLSPYDVLVSALQPRLGISFGQTVWLISAVMFVIAAALGERPSRWGIAYVLSIGFAVDAVAGAVNSPASMAGRVSFVFAALFVISAGVSLVVHSGSTGGGFELLMRAGEVRGKDRRVVRTSLEVGVLSFGIALGGSFGPATLIIALGIGPVLGLMGQALEDHSRGRTHRLVHDSPESRHPSAMAQRSA